MEVVHFQAKTPPKLIDQQPTLSATWPKNIVAAGLADQCEVQVAYAIGVAQPVSLLVNTAGTSKIPEEEIERLVREHFDLRPKAIIQMLDLLRPI